MNSYLNWNSSNACSDLLCYGHLVSCNCGCKNVRVPHHTGMLPLDRHLLLVRTILCQTFSYLGLTGCQHIFGQGTRDGRRTSGDLWISWGVWYRHHRDLWMVLLWRFDPGTTSDDARNLWLHLAIGNCQAWICNRLGRTSTADLWWHRIYFSLQNGPSMDTY